MLFLKSVEAKRRKDDMAMLRSASRSVLVTAFSAEAPAQQADKQVPAYTSTDVETRVYTEGSCLENTGPGGWGVIIDHEKRLHSRYLRLSEQTENCFGQKAWR